MKPVKWGIISTANIGVEKVLPGMLKSKDLEIVAISSRKLKTAQEWAGKLGIPKAYGSYEEMLADPEIEAVYNPLPNHLHVPLTLAAAKAGKHVLCEKPIAITAAEAKQLKKIRNVHVAEAFMVRHATQWIAARDLVKKKKIGEVRAIQVLFSYFNRDPKNVRNMADIGGGGIMDIGCYMTIFSRWMLGAEPKRVVGLIERDPGFGTDRLASAILDFGDGRRSVWTTSTQLAPAQRFTVLGTKGRLEVEIPCNAPNDRPCRIIVDDGRDLVGGGREVIEFPTCDQYRLQGEMFSKAVRGEGKLAMTLDESIANMKVLDALFASEKSGGWVGV